MELDDLRGLDVAELEAILASLVLCRAARRTAANPGDTATRLRARTVAA